MFGAIYIGLSGLNAYSQGLQKVSNNVSNLNTTGFKGSTVTFQNFYGLGDGGGLAYTVNTRGSGLGVGMGESLLDLKAGELRESDRDLDLAIDGNGFLVLLDGDKQLYTRTGSFEVDKDGYIVLSGTNYRLATLDTAGHPVSLSIDQQRSSAPKPTTTIKFVQNISADAPNPVVVADLKVYDSSGSLHVWKTTFTQSTGSDNTWTVDVADEKGSIGTGTLKFLPTGALDPSSPATIDITDGTHNFTVKLDFTGATSYAGGTSSDVHAGSIDGYGLGVATTVGINDKGEVEIQYSNTQKVTVGAVALADFRDVRGLEQRSGGLFAFNGTGERELMTSDDARVGLVKGKRLEASNVDLSKEFGDLILIQRGFQASSQIISVSNDMIQQLFGIRGQGG